MATIDLLEETANYLLNHCFVLGCVEEQRAKYLYIQDHLNEVRAVFKPLGYAVLLYPAPMQAAALVNEHEGSQARLLKYESILLLVLRLLYLQKRESLAASADEVLVTVEEVQAELQKMNLPRKLDQCSRSFRAGPAARTAGSGARPAAAPHGIRGIAYAVPPSRWSRLFLTQTRRNAHYSRFRRTVQAARREKHRKSVRNVLRKRSGNCAHGAVCPLDIPRKTGKINL